MHTELSGIVAAVSTSMASATTLALVAAPAAWIQYIFAVLSLADRRSAERIFWLAVPCV